MPLKSIIIIKNNILIYSVSKWLCQDYSLNFATMINAPSPIIYVDIATV